MLLQHALYIAESNAWYWDDAWGTEQVYVNVDGTTFGRVFMDSTFEDSGGRPSAAGPMHVYMRLPDPLGSASFVIDHDTSELVEAPTYLAYGGVDSDYRPARWASDREDERYTGQWDDAEVGLVYMGARYYSPQLSRFISPDPLTIHGWGSDENPYEYANGSPFRFVDPTGLDGSTITLPVTVIAPGGSYTQSNGNGVNEVTIIGQAPQSPAVSGPDDSHSQPEPGEGQTPDPQGAALTLAIQTSAGAGPQGGAQIGPASGGGGGGTPGDGPGGKVTFWGNIARSAIETAESVLGPASAANAPTSGRQRAQNSVSNLNFIVAVAMAVIVGKALGKAVPLFRNLGGGPVGATEAFPAGKGPRRNKGCGNYA